jgi:hypothetical protein
MVYPPTRPYATHRLPLIRAISARGQYREAEDRVVTTLASTERGLE